MSYGRGRKKSCVGDDTLKLLTAFAKVCRPGDCKIVKLTSPVLFFDRCPAKPVAQMRF